MHKIIYEIDPSKKEEELEWLTDQKVFPAFHEGLRLESTNLSSLKPILHVGVIVGDAAALAIRLRHRNIKSSTIYGSGNIKRNR